MSDKVIMPKALTAENGAKYLMIGEFKEYITLTCMECWNEPDGDGCELCGGDGEFVQEVHISWTNIKKIYALAVRQLGEEIT